mmetsp:Transcript_14909/g.2497  ORF Transcript_14909/g.2497 Transcript_14909/m.2497 type:complete len:97 (+) Transcript_14909:1629-1919(+)
MSIDAKLLPAILSSLKPPLGFRGTFLKKSEQITFIKALKIRLFKKKLHFALLLWRLAHLASGVDMSEAPSTQILKDIQKKFPLLYPEFELKPNEDF